MNNTGGIVLWNDIEEPDWVKLRFPAAQKIEDIEIPYTNGASVPPLKIGIAVVPPKALTQDNNTKQ